MIQELEARVTAVGERINALPSWLLDRAVGAVIGLPSLGVLLIGAWLTPSPQGYGTHTQLGMGGCTMLTLSGWPCPMCGMTTTFSHMSHLHLLDAAINQPFGVVLWSLTLATAAIGLSDLVAARGLWRKALAVVQRREDTYAMFLLVGLLGGWLYKCVRLHPELLGGLLGP